MKLFLTFCAIITTIFSFATFNKELFDKAKLMSMKNKKGSVEVYTQVIDEMNEREIAQHPDVFYRRALQAFLNQDETFQIELAIDDLNMAKKHSLKNSHLNMAANYYIALAQLRKKFTSDKDFAVAANEENEAMLRLFVIGSESKFSDLRGEVLAELLTNDKKMEAFSNMIIAINRYPFVALGDVDAKVIVAQSLKAGRVCGIIHFSDQKGNLKDFEFYM